MKFTAAEARAKSDNAAEEINRHLVNIEKCIKASCTQGDHKCTVNVKEPGVIDILISKLSALGYMCTNGVNSIIICW